MTIKTLDALSPSIFDANTIELPKNADMKMPIAVESGEREQVEVVESMASLLLEY